MQTDLTRRIGTHYCLCNGQKVISPIRALPIEVSSGEFPIGLFLRPRAVWRFDHVANSCHECLPFWY
eukprot:scaffold1956_cov70-Skeletonema_menzelii.AAC.1